MEDLESRMEEFQHLLEMNRSDSGQCLFKQMPRMAEKFKEMQDVFKNIDRYKSAFFSCLTCMTVVNLETTQTRA